MFKELYVVVGALKAGANCSFVMNPCGEEKTYVSFLDHGGDCPLHIECGQDGQHLIISCRHEGQWKTLDSIHVEITKSGTLVEVSLDELCKIMADSRHVSECALDIAVLSRICGEGGITNFAVISSDDDAHVASKVLEKLPDGNLGALPFRVELGLG